MSASVYFEKRDVWVGVYWGRKTTYEPVMRGTYMAQQPVEVLEVYICLLPMLPLKLTFRLGHTRGTC